MLSAEAQVAEAYRVCNAIARKEAKNFYYSFVALPRVKRDAICAVYAFMRHADDLSDDESLPIGERRLRLDAWLGAWRTAASDGQTDDPVFIALRDAQRHFEIPSRLLEQLVEGTTMDLHRAGEAFSAEGFANKSGEKSDYDTYETFEELYRYCYLVASVVGLVCIRIFGYEDARAEKLAEETGIAFQLTNIVRDVREDAECGRIYLPAEDMRRFGVTMKQLASAGGVSGVANETRELLHFEAARAEQFYESGNQLLPLIAADSRPAMWVLITIYHRLLQRIEKSGYDVFSTRASVPIYEKLAILGWGIVRVLANRLFRRG